MSSPQDAEITCPSCSFDSLTAVNVRAQRYRCPECGGDWTIEIMPGGGAAHRVGAPILRYWPNRPSKPANDAAT